MPAEDQPNPGLQPEQPQGEADWVRLAQEAAEWPENHEGLQRLRENHVNGLLGEKGLGHLVVSKEDKAGARYLHQYGTLDQQEVNHVVGYLRRNGTTIPDKAAERTAAYLDFMADTKLVNDGVVSGDQPSIDRQIAAHVIKTEDVPESYFALQRRIAREQGHGDIEITPDMKQQLVEAAQADQRGSLGKWVEYLGGDDGSYPNWFKRYTWDSVTRLGQYNKESGKFGRRDTETVAPYAELNREALAYTYDAIKKFHVLGESVDDTQLKQLLKEGGFGRLYAHAVHEVTPDSPELRNDVRGSWTRFNQTNDPRTARRLSGSLQGHGTGWCTAGESTASAQLQGGDFYVYYTRDEDGNDTVPRVAIRMQGDEVGEVRGVNAAQELEPVMADVTTERLQDLPGGEEYIQRAADMKHLTAIDKLLTTDPNAELSAEDVVFLYELNRTIEGFGYEDDPRVQELQLKAVSAHKAELLEQIDANATMTKRVRSHVRAHDILDFARPDPEIVFSDDDLRFIYGLDGPIQTLNPDDYELARSFDYYREGRDRERVLQLMPEALTGQYSAAVEGYAQTARTLGAEVADTETLKREFASKLATWQEQGVYQYVLEELIEHDTQFNLVMTPNVLASTDQIMNAAEAFGEGQTYTTYVNRELYSQYTGNELSGAPERDVVVRFSLMPNKYSRDLGRAPVEEQRIKLQQLRARLPQLALRIPSVLEAVSYWQSLRARGDTLSGDGTTEKTYIRHLDLEPKRLRSWSLVPRSYVNDDGKPGLNFSNAGNDNDARLAVR